ncbi:putative indole-3-pyruvate monooxygenase YUCCA3 [Cyphellophora attinorum]|uniref:Putative indole-3-pyruvate monooxygenase YUCCA3 n=1 Tax=Cyphellophora attinorum TaxID=1664694 RepID=A0A0N1P2F3_9EURO|nr:putative indole-3-pyruvate monooxygenase YUCCA3 [Phialophora attinorum]KPI43444.1 putative indole-3-pyruvate monooxygenase YUCCA3 [Phialophora attinorum]
MTAAVQPHNLSTPSFRRLEPGSVNLLPHKFTSSGSDDADPAALATETIDAFNKALSGNDVIAVAGLFAEDSYWRDHLGLTWDVRTFFGKAMIQEQLSQNGCAVTSVKIDDSSAYRAPHIAAFDGASKVKGIEFFITFESKVGSGRGTCRLFEENGKWKIFSFFTSLRNIKGHEEATGPRRPTGVVHGGQPGRKNWVERRQSEQHYEDGREPTVIILGAGQGGLTVAARLKMLGVDALIVDQNQRVGDNWRNRYHQLVLHDPVWYDHMPYIPFPDSWPIFTPKDKLGDWFEQYAHSLELNVWMKSTITKISWSEAYKTWTVHVDRTLSDGTTESRTLHPHHIIQATGHSGKANMPSIRGIDQFKGDVLCHSSKFPGAKPDSKGKKQSSLDAAIPDMTVVSQSYYENGYDITMVQRSSTCVVSSRSITEISLAGVFYEGGPPVDDADLWLHGTPMPLLKLIQVGITSASNEMDKETLAGLEKAGFALDKGPDDAGLLMKYYQRGGGYYIDVGASQLIIDGRIKIKQGSEISEVTEHGLKFADGTELEADEIVFATGYMNMRTEARSIFGAELADRINDIWGFDQEGEMRYFSKVLALQIKAREIGLNPA